MRSVEHVFVRQTHICWCNKQTHIRAYSCRKHTRSKVNMNVMCVCTHTNTRTHAHTYTHKLIHTHTHTLGFMAAMMGASRGWTAEVCACVRRACMRVRACWRACKCQGLWLRKWVISVISLLKNGLFIRSVCTAASKACQQLVKLVSS